METQNVSRIGAISAMNSVLHGYGEVWLVQFEVHERPGEPPCPKGLSATELRSGRRVGLDQKRLPGGMPYRVDDASLIVVYDASVAMACHLALGWPLPVRVLDLHA